MGLEGKEFFSQNEPLKAKLSDAPKIATSFHLLMSAHIGGGLWGEREVPRESPPPLCYGRNATFFVTHKFDQWKIDWDICDVV